MGSSLGPMLANIIMSELENKIIMVLLSDGVKFCCRYVDDTLIVIKSEEVSRVHNLLNQLDNKLRFTVDFFLKNQIILAEPRCSYCFSKFWDHLFLFCCCRNYNFWPCITHIFIIHAEYFWLVTAGLKGKF